MVYRTLIEDTILPFVAKPNRYIGNFVRTRSDRFSSASLRVIVVHPEVFEAGLADRDTRSAYATLNALPGVAADLAFLPWPDMATRLEKSAHPLWGLETFTPLSGFDVVLFTPASVLMYVPMLRILSLSGIPLLRSERGPDAPIVAALGLPMGNPAPLASFLDAVFLGEPEAVLHRPIAALSGAAGRPRAERIEELRRFPGTIVLPGEDRKAPAGVPVRAVVTALDQVDPPDPGLLPLIEAGHEGLSLEIRRGGTPLRFESGWRSHARAWEMSVDSAVERAGRGLSDTGFDRIDLTGDAPCRHGKLLFLTESLVRRHPTVRVVLTDFGTSEPGPALAREMLRGRRAAFAWSPLAGSPRLRRVLNLEFDDEMFLEAVGTALRGGCHMIRLRFGIGWPTETDADLEALGNLVKQVRSLKASGSAPRIQVQLMPFVPKPHTPFQWEAQLEPAELARRVERLREDVEHGAVQVRVVPPELAALETILARGGSEIAPVLVRAMANGAASPNVSETWEAGPWLEALSASGITIPSAVAAIPLDARLPWSDIEVALPAEILKEERTRALAAELTASSLLEPAARAVVVEMPPVVVPVVSAPVESTREGTFGRSSRRKSSPGTMRQASRFRLRFSKGNEVRFTAHLDVARAFERALRRLSSTPGPLRGKAFKLSFGPPLPLGMTGEDEYLDITFADEVPETALATLGDLLPQGLLVHDVRPIRASVESLCQAIDTAVYRVDLPAEFIEKTTKKEGPPLATRLSAAMSRALAQHEIMVPKSPEDDMNRVDARPTLLHGEVLAGDGGHPALKLHLAVGSPGNVRPEVLLPILTAGSFDPRLARIHRLALRISGAGKDFSPLEVVELDFPWWRETLRRRAAGQRS
jgi:radical SAM-linked protein